MQPVTTDTVIARIRAWMLANDYSVNAFAQIAGVSEGTIRDIHDDAWRPSLATMRKLEAVIPAGWQPGDDLPPIEARPEGVLRPAQDEDAA